MWLGGFLILVGLLLLLDRVRVLDFGNIISTWWPLILIGVGLNRVFTRYNIGFGLLLLFVGVVLQLAKLDVLQWGDVSLLWPVLLIVFGIWLLLKAWRGKTAASSRSTDLLNVSAILGGVEQKIVSQQFKGGEATAIMGGIELDLREAQLGEGQNELQLTAIMGGVGIRIPENWGVIVSGTPILGGIENKTRKGADTAASGVGTLRIQGFALLGGIEIKN